MSNYRKNSGKKILIVAPAWIGDAVMSLALIQRLKQQNPLNNITVLTPSWCVGVYSIYKDVQHIVILDIAHGVFGFSERWRCASKLRECEFDAAYVLPNSWKSALVPFLARIPKRIGFVGEMRWMLLNNCHPSANHLPLLVDKYQSLAGEDGVFLRPKIVIDPIQFEAKKRLAEHGLTMDKPIMAFCPGAEYGVAKRWPASYYAELANYYLMRGWQVWLFGSTKDEAVAREIITDVSQEGIVSWVGKTSVSEVIYLINLAKMVVTNDSGLMHIGAALNIPMVALFGSSTPNYTPPLSENSTVLYLNSTCSPCFKRVCPLETDNLHCLTRIMPQQVIEIISQKLANS